MASIFIAHTGWWWLNVIVYVVSGGAFLGVLYTLPGYYQNVIKPTVDELLEYLHQLQEQRKQRKK